MKGKFCPVKALVRRYVNLRDNKAAKDDIISSFYDHVGVGHVADLDICKSLRMAVVVLGLAKNGIIEAKQGLVRTC